MQVVSEKSRLLHLQRSSTENLLQGESDETQRENILAISRVFQLLRVTLTFFEESFVPLEIAYTSIMHCAASLKLSESFKCSMVFICPL